MTPVENRKKLWDPHLADPSGSALIITLLVLTAVTILGVACIRSSIVELKISANEKDIKRTFYLSEGGAMEGVQRLYGLKADDLNDRSAFWHHPGKTSGDKRLNFRKTSSWHTDPTSSPNCLKSSLDTDTYIAAVEWKVAAGASLIMTESRLYQNRVYSLCKKYDANHLIEIGYNLRY